VDLESRSATVLLSPTGTLGLRPGQAVSVRIYTRDAQTSAGVTVPEEAIQTVEGREVVFVRTAKGFKAVAVIVGQRGGGRAQVTSGLTAGQSIATRNAFLLKAEMGKGEGEEH
jgi:cobalt-zinc-cadmium efflux system membrane fusion protein